MKKLTLFLIALFIVATNSAYTTCLQYIDAITNIVVNQNYASLPLPTIMYSGITTNNPGQKYEC